MKYKIKYINLDRRADRLIKFVEQMEKQGVDNYDRYSAIDGKNLVIDDKLKQMFRNNKFNWRGGILGVTLSHTNLWRELINGDDDYYIIFEDDITLTDTFKPLFDDFLKKIEEKTYPFIFLGYHTDRQFIRNPFFIKKKENEITIYPQSAKKFIWGGLFAYAIHRDTAKLYIDNIDKDGIQDPIDTYILAQEKLYTCHPLIVDSPFMTYYNCVDSDIQYDIISIFDKYDFYQFCDSPGNDIRWVSAKTFDELKIAADNDPECVAFNTYGFLKRKICDPKNFVNLPSINSKSHGIYVKRK